MHAGCVNIFDVEDEDDVALARALAEKVAAHNSTAHDVTVLDMRIFDALSK